MEKRRRQATQPVWMLRGAQPQLVSLLLPHVFYDEHVILPSLNEKKGDLKKSIDGIGLPSHKPVCLQPGTWDIIGLSRLPHHE